MTGCLRRTLTGSAKALGDEDTVEEGADRPANAAHGERVGVLAIRSKLREATSALSWCMGDSGSTNLAEQDELVWRYAVFEVMAESAKANLQDGLDCGQVVEDQAGDY